eukprot:Sspe_Gene.65464::Locus_38755_Transcript_1_1_Confidence_1.000_Length_1145::g.65464::m.65464
MAVVLTAWVPDVAGSAPQYQAAVPQAQYVVPQQATPPTPSQQPAQPVQLQVAQSVHGMQLARAQPVVPQQALLAVNWVGRNRYTLQQCMHCSSWLQILLTNDMRTVTQCGSCNRLFLLRNMLAMCSCCNAILQAPPDAMVLQCCVCNHINNRSYTPMAIPMQQFRPSVTAAPPQPTIALMEEQLEQILAISQTQVGSVLERLPVRKVEKSGEGECPICLDEYEVGEELRTLPCFHRYHCRCIDKWMSCSNGTCPVCKACVHDVLQQADAFAPCPSKAPLVKSHGGGDCADRMT